MEVTEVYDRPASVIIAHIFQQIISVILGDKAYLAVEERTGYYPS